MTAILAIDLINVRMFMRQAYEDLASFIGETSMRQVGVLATAKNRQANTEK
jgi:hypothetical protein